MKKYFLWSLLVVAALVVCGQHDVFAAKGKTPKGKPKAVAKEAEWKVVGVFSAEDFDDQDDFDALTDLGDLTLRNYQRFEGTKEAVLVSKKKLQLEEFEVDGKKHLFLYGQEQLGHVQFADPKVQRKVEGYVKDLAKHKHDGKAYELYAESDKNAPARCYAAGARILFPPYNVYDWSGCVAWAQSTGMCRQVEWPQSNPRRSTDGCKCFY